MLGRPEVGRKSDSHFPLLFLWTLMIGSCSAVQFMCYECNSDYATAPNITCEDPVKNNVAAVKCSEGFVCGKYTVHSNLKVYTLVRGCFRFYGHSCPRESCIDDTVAGFFSLSTGQMIDAPYNAYGKNTISTVCLCNQKSKCNSELGAVALKGNLLQVAGDDGCTSCTFLVATLFLTLHVFMFDGIL